MKKVSLFLVVVLLMLSFAGCGSNGAETSAPANEAEGQAASESKEPVKVVFWTSMSGSLGDVQAEIIDDFNASQDEVFVEAAFQGNYYDMGAKLQAAVAAGEVPHIAQVEMGRLKFFDEAEALADMRPYIEAANIDLDDFVPGLMSFSYVDDRVISMPFNRSTPLFYYNKDHFREVGLDPERPPQTWDELEEYAAKLSIDGKRWGFGVPIDAWFYEAMIMQGDGRILNADETSIGFNNNTGTDPLYFWKKMVEQDYMKIPVGKEYNSFTLNRNDFSGEITSMIIDSTGALAGLTASSEFEIGAAFLPKNKRFGVPTGGANVVMMAGHNAEEEAAAWKFIEYLTSTEAVTKWAIGTGYIPARFSAVESDEFQSFLAGNPNAQVAIDQLEYADIPRPFNAMYNEIHGVAMMNAIQKCIIDEGYSPEQAVADIAKETEALLK